jgi:hypothetical protein
MVYTKANGCFLGEIHTAQQAGEDEEQWPTLRLQDMLNNPYMLFTMTGMGSSWETPTEQFLLRNVRNVLDEDEEAPVMPKMVLRRDSIDVVYDISGVNYESRRHNYERKFAPDNDEPALVEMASGKRIWGCIQPNMRVLTHPSPHKKFFALTEARIHIMEPFEHTEHASYVLINRDQVRHFRPFYRPDRSHLQRVTRKLGLSVDSAFAAA